MTEDEGPGFVEEADEVIDEGLEKLEKQAEAPGPSHFKRYVLVLLSFFFDEWIGSLTWLKARGLSTGIRL
jgi:hypothetical protein